MSPDQQHFLNQYLATLSSEARQNIPSISAEYFCADEYNANLCADLINRGIKTATSSLKAAYHIEKLPLPETGHLTVVLNWAQNPVCIIETIEVNICRFDQVSAEFAYAEGENDRSLSSWRRAHQPFFEDYARRIGSVFHPDSELVLEHFKKVFPLR